MPTHDIVAEGVRIAIEFAQDANASRERRVKLFESTLIVRESTAPPAQRSESLPGAQPSDGRTG